MSQKKSLSNKIADFIYGPTSSDAANTDESALHQKLEAILKQLNQQSEANSNNNDLAEEVRKLAKTQFKTNTLQEKQAAQQEAALEEMQKALEQMKSQQAEQVQQAVAAARLELLEGLLPSLDSLDAAFNNGRRQVLKQPLTPESRRAVVAWLDGVRLARLRLLDVLKAHDINRIPTVGHPFDPHLHVAVATDSSGRAPDGVIISEDRPGYTTPDKVLRFAEVVVSRH